LLAVLKTQKVAQVNNTIRVLCKGEDNKRKMIVVYPQLPDAFAKLQTATTSLVMCNGREENVVKQHN